MPPYRKQPVKHVRLVFGPETDVFAGTEVVIRTRLEVGNAMSLIPNMDLLTESRESTRKRVVDWGDNWLVSWNVEEPVLGPDGEQVIGPDGEPMWAPMPCDGEHLADCDPEFFLVLRALVQAKLEPKVVEAATLDPNSPGSSDSGANRGPSSAQPSAAKNEAKPANRLDATPVMLHPN